MPKLIDMTGETFGRWTVLAPSARARHWQCRCACGKEADVHGSNLRSGKSPGCHKCGAPRISVIDKIMARCIPEPMSGCLLWEGRVDKRSGRPVVETASGPTKTELVSRVMYRLAKGPVPADIDVLHVCDVGLCIEPSHLWLGTHADNMKDAARKNRVRFGRWHHGTKLTEDEVQEIREWLAAGATLRSIGAVFGVSAGAISDLKRGITHRRTPGAQWRG